MSSDENPVGGAPPAVPRKSEDTAAGCRSLASNDRARAVDSDIDRMRFRLACSAEAWTARAELLDRLEANRVRMNGAGGFGEAAASTGDNDHG